jgi:hypothetical protein
LSFPTFREISLILSSILPIKFSLVLSSLLVWFFFFWDRVSLCSPVWTQTSSLSLSLSRSVSLSLSLMVLEFELRASLALARQALYHLNHASRPFCF